MGVLTSEFCCVSIYLVSAVLLGHHLPAAAVSGQRGRVRQSERRRVGVQAESEQRQEDQTVLPPHIKQCTPAVVSRRTLAQRAATSRAALTSATLPLALCAACVCAGRYRGGYHDLLSDSIREQVFDDVVRWLDERVDR